MSTRKVITYALIIAAIAAIIFGSVAARAQDWKPNPKYIKQTHQDTARSQQNKIQCYGTTTQGHRCKRQINAGSKFCYQHTSQQ